MKHSELERLPNLLPWVVGIAFVVLAGAYVWAFNQLPSRESPPAWGSFGDYVGGLLNPLVSTFTLIVAVKVWQQQKVELQQTKEALEEQAKTAEQQRREQRFFDLMRFYQNELNNIQYYGTIPGSKYNGKQAIEEWFRLEYSFKDLPDFPSAEGNLNPSESRKQATHYNHIEKLKATWRDGNLKSILERHCDCVLSIIDISSKALDQTEKNNLYLNLFKAQLSQHELMLMGIFLWLSGTERHKEISEDHSLLKHFPESKFRDFLITELPMGTFGKTQ